MGWSLCQGGNSGGVPSVTFDLSLYVYNQQYSENIQLAKGVGYGGVVGASVTLMKFIANGSLIVNITPFKLFTNTSNGDGYFELLLNGVSKYKKSLPTNTWTALTDIVPVELASGDTLECNVGFDNRHSNCDFYYSQYQSS